jgi:phosphoribosylamine--glycine ligase
MQVLIIGSGGREHALAWKLAQTDEVERIYVAPGNGGTAAEAKCRNLALDPLSPGAQEALVSFARKEGISLTVVGPEAPLAAGIVDRFRSAGLAIVGPDQNAARLEASKVFSKSFMHKYGIPTAGSSVFSDVGEALAYGAAHFAAPGTGGAAPLVIKADGLAAGKGVVIAQDFAEAEVALRSFMADGILGAAGRTVVLEDFLPGKEVSVLAAVSAVKGRAGIIRPFIAARDHKRRFDGDKGPNTGGMGAIAPGPDFLAAEGDVRSAILEPTLRGIEEEGMDYRGFIFFGLMVNEGRCFLLEYNVRLGDPETQAVLPLLDSDLAGLCCSILDGSLGAFPLVWRAGAVCAPVAVAEGYPGSYRKGDLIGLDQARLGDAKVFIAGAEAREGGLYTSGGRVLAVSAWGVDAGAARDRAYDALAGVHFANMSFRSFFTSPPGPLPRAERV